MTETLIVAVVLMVLGGLAGAHGIYILKNRPKRGQGWWWGEHPILTALIAGWPRGHTGRLRARVLFLIGLGAIAFGLRLLLAL